MKRNLFSLLAIVTISLFCSQLFAQETTKQMRREQRQEANQAFDDQLSKDIQAKDFTFRATELVYGQDPNLQNITLNALYFLTVSPNYFRVYLPIYGPNNFNGQPSLMHKLDFFVNSYKFSTEPIDKGGWIIRIDATDPWNINTYNFRIRSTPNGNFSSMTVETIFTGPVIYNGTVQTN